MRPWILAFAAGIAASTAFAHNGLRITSQQAVAVYGGAQGVLSYAGGGEAHGASGWARPISHTIDVGDTVYLVARAGDVALRGILAEVAVSGERVLSGDARWEMFTINPGRLSLGTAPDESTLFAWVNTANDARVWRFPDLSGVNDSSSPEFMEGIERCAVRMSKRLAATEAADLGGGTPAFVVCRLRFSKNPTDDGVIDENQRQNPALGGSIGAHGGSGSSAPSSASAGGGGGGGDSGEIPGLLDPSPDDPTDDVPLTETPPDGPTENAPTESTPVVPTVPTQPPIDPTDPFPSAPPTPEIPNQPPHLPPHLPQPPREPPTDSPPLPPQPPAQPTVPNVPSPGTLMLAGIGAVVAAARRRRHRRV